MHRSHILPFALLLLAVPVRAQVTVDLHALDALPNNGSGLTRPAPPVVRQRPQARPAPRPAEVSREQAPVTPPTLPTETPPTASLSPVAPLPLATTPPPPADAAPPPAAGGTLASNAVGTVQPSATSSLRVAFTTGQGDLTQDGSSAIRRMVDSAPRSDTTTYNVVAYAAGTPDDPSTARRLSLSRALAVRNALLADGVASTRIFVRALGAQSDGGPADRVDLTVMGGSSMSDASSSTSNRPQ